MVDTKFMAGGLSLPKKTVARMAGVARTTLDRAIANPASSSIDTLREIALAEGRDFVVTYPPLYDLNGVAAVRSILDPTFSAPQSATEWVDRLSRWVSADSSELELVEKSASTAMIANAPQSTSYSRSSLIDIASYADASQAKWAVSGAAALGVSGTSIVWAEDYETTIALASEDLPSYRGELPAVIVLPAPSWLFQGAYVDSLLRYVDPTQMIIDCFSYGNSLEEDARKEVKSWMNPDGK